MEVRKGTRMLVQTAGGQRSWPCPCSPGNTSTLYSLQPRCQGSVFLSCPVWAHVGLPPLSPAATLYPCLSNYATSSKACPRSHTWYVSSVMLRTVNKYSPIEEICFSFCFSLKENPVTRWHHFYHTSRGRTPVLCRNRRVTHLSCQLHRFQRDSHYNLSLWSCWGHRLSIVSRRQ